MLNFFHERHSTYSVLGIVKFLGSMCRDKNGTNVKSIYNLKTGPRNLLNKGGHVIFIPTFENGIELIEILNFKLSYF